MDYGLLSLDYRLLIVIGILTAYLFTAIRIVKENERLAVFALGRFAGFKGPGLILKMPLGPSELVRIALGAEGEIQSNELMAIAGHAVPFKIIGSNLDNYQLLNEIHKIR